MSPHPLPAQPCKQMCKGNTACFKKGVPLREGTGTTAQEKRHKYRQFIVSCRKVQVGLWDERRLGKCLGTRQEYIAMGNSLCRGQVWEEGKEDGTVPVMPWRDRRQR